MVALLWMQLAVAAYACPAFNMPATAAGVMPDCGEMSAMPNAADPANPNLCLQYCQKPAQHSDTAPAVPAAIAPALLLAFAWPDPAIGVSRLVVSSGRGLARSGAPPKTILHCCYRI